MFNHILVPIDGSDASMYAVSKASGLALAFGSRITLIHVVDNYPFIGVGADYALGQNEYLAAATSSANAALARGVAALGKTWPTRRYIVAARRETAKVLVAAHCISASLACHAPGAKDPARCLVDSLDYPRPVISDSDRSKDATYLRFFEAFP